MAREMCEVREARSSMVDTDASPRFGRRGAAPSRRERSCTRLEKDITGDGFRWGGCRETGHTMAQGDRLGFCIVAVESQLSQSKAEVWPDGRRNQYSILRRTQGRRFGGH